MKTLAINIILQSNFKGMFYLFIYFDTLIYYDKNHNHANIYNNKKYIEIIFNETIFNKCSSISQNFILT